MVNKPVDSYQEVENEAYVESIDAAVNNMTNEGGVATEISHRPQNTGDRNGRANAPSDSNVEQSM